MNMPKSVNRAVIKFRWNRGGRACQDSHCEEFPGTQHPLSSPIQSNQNRKMLDLINFRRSISARVVHTALTHRDDSSCCQAYEVMISST